MTLSHLKFYLTVLTCALFVAVSCSYLPIKPDDTPPPLPPIIDDKKPPLEMKSLYFRSFPWDELEKPGGEGNPPNTFVYNVKEGDTLESIAKEQMGDDSLAVGLATYNGLSSTMAITENEKIIIPYPIIGMQSEVMVKSKGDDDIGPPNTFDVNFKKGDQFRMRFEPNVDGHCYIFRVTARSTSMVYPYEEKTGSTRRRRPRSDQAGTVKRKSSKVKAHEPFELPEDEELLIEYKSTMAGDRLFVFLSIRPIPSLEELKDSRAIEEHDLQYVMDRVRQEKIFEEPPVKLLRVESPVEILGYALNIKGN